MANHRVFITLNPAQLEYIERNMPFGDSNVQKVAEALQTMHADKDISALEAASLVEVSYKSIYRAIKKLGKNIPIAEVLAMPDNRVLASRKRHAMRKQARQPNKPSISANKQKPLFLETKPVANILAAPTLKNLTAEHKEYLFNKMLPAIFESNMFWTRELFAHTVNCLFSDFPKDLINQFLNNQTSTKLLG